MGWVWPRGTLLGQMFCYSGPRPDSTIPPTASGQTQANPRGWGHGDHEQIPSLYISHILDALFSPSLFAHTFCLFTLPPFLHKLHLLVLRVPSRLPVLVLIRFSLPSPNCWPLEIFGLPKWIWLDAELFGSPLDECQVLRDCGLPGNSSDTVHFLKSIRQVTFSAYVCGFALGALRCVWLHSGLLWVHLGLAHFGFNARFLRILCNKTSVLNLFAVVSVCAYSQSTYSTSTYIALTTGRLIHCDFLITLILSMTLSFSHTTFPPLTFLNITHSLTN